jgi:hypothetical protein
MTLSEADTIAKLITPTLYKCGWMEEHCTWSKEMGHKRGFPK